MGELPALTSEPEEIRKALRAVLRQGLPATPETAGELLPHQRVVIAHAQHPDQLASRVTALDRFLRQLLRDYGDSDRGRLARILFGADRGLRGTTLTFRRETAGEVVGRHPDHIRKHIEPTILDELAFAIEQQNLRYTPRTEGRRPEIAAHEDTPVLTDNSFTEREEALSRIWSAVYGYRAEIIAVQRRLDAGEEEDAQEFVEAAQWELARLLTLVHDWLDNYGEDIEQGDVEFKVEGLVKLAGWSGGLSSDTAKRLRLLYAQGKLQRPNQ